MNVLPYRAEASFQRTALLTLPTCRHYSLHRHIPRAPRYFMDVRLLRLASSPLPFSFAIYSACFATFGHPFHHRIFLVSLVRVLGMAALLDTALYLDKCLPSQCFLQHVHCCYISYIVSYSLPKLLYHRAAVSTLISSIPMASLSGL